MRIAVLIDLFIACAALNAATYSRMEQEEGTLDAFIVRCSVVSLREKCTKSKRFHWRRKVLGTLFVQANAVRRSSSILTATEVSRISTS